MLPGFHRLVYEAAADFVLMLMIATASCPNLSSDKFTTVHLVSCTAEMDPKANAKV